MVDVVTLDGPAGSGKSTLAKKLADELGFQFLDTGATYRAVTDACLRRGVNFDDINAITEVAASLNITFEDGGKRVLVNGEDRSFHIRTREVTNAIAKVNGLRTISELFFPPSQ